MHIKSSFPLLPCFEVGSIFFFSTLNIPLFQQLKAKGGSRMWLKVKMAFGRSEVVHWDLVASSLFPRGLHVWNWEATGRQMG